METNTNVTKLIERVLAGKSEVIKLGVDVHARNVVVSLQLDGALPQRAQKMLAAQLVGIARGLVQRGNSKRSGRPAM
jgi:predicted hotdog family 3-hydroxylacyl-ACP dehydratase